MRAWAVLAVLTMHAIAGAEDLRDDPVREVTFHGPFEPWELSVEGGGGLFAHWYVARGSVDFRFRPKKWFSTGVRIGGGSTVQTSVSSPPLGLATVDAIAQFKGGVFFAGVLAGPWFLNDGPGMKPVGRAAVSFGLEAWRFTLSGEFGLMVLYDGTLHGSAEARLGFRIF